MDSNNIFDNNSAHNEHEKTIIKVLISLAILMIAGIVVYNAFFKKEISAVNFTSESKTVNTPREQKIKNKRLININTASKKEIAQNINGIGEKTAAKIISYRKTNGGFKSKEELMNIKGISKNKFEKIKNSIIV